MAIIHYLDGKHHNVIIMCDSSRERKSLIFCRKYQNDMLPNSFAFKFWTCWRKLHMLNQDIFIKFILKFRRNPSFANFYYIIFSSLFFFSISFSSEYALEITHLLCVISSSVGHSNFFYFCFSFLFFFPFMAKLLWKMYVHNFDSLGG